MAKTKRMMLGLLLTLGMIMGMSVITKAASVSSVVAKFELRKKIKEAKKAIDEIQREIDEHKKDR